MYVYFIQVYFCVFLQNKSNYFKERSFCKIDKFDYFGTQNINNQHKHHFFDVIDYRVESTMDTWFQPEWTFYKSILQS